MRIPDAIHEELLNWSRWCWQGEWPHPLPATHCGSLESQYRAPPDWNPDDAKEAPEPPPIRPNERNARIVQAVYDELSYPEKTVLQAEYPARRKYQNRTHAATRLGLSRFGYESLLQAAVTKVGEAFEVCS